ncbi:MAG: RagB/SusD family nutrient uptake outer membrane protein [Saprospiraceae bacterium]|nr:RagB/SusD family nutrient uptake outer membrane protein [Saprospiraceae bacterium]
MIRYLLGLTIVIFIGCSTASNEPQFTISDFEDALDDSYEALSSFGDYYLPISNLSADEVGVPGLGSHLSNGAAITEMVRHLWTPDNTLTTILWSDLYNAVNAANTALALVPQINDNISTIQQAEARALRAFNYFLLLDIFGNIQAFKEDVLTGNINVPQVSRAQVFEFIETELLETIPQLSKDPIYGRVTQSVAQTILAKLYLNAEIFKGTPEWAACRDACTAVISSGDYRLTNDYFDVFKTNNSVTGAEEIIMASTENPAVHPSRLSVHPAQVDTKNPSTSGFFNYAATPEFSGLFDFTNDRRSDAILRGLQLASTGDVILTASGDSVNYVMDFRGEVNFLNGYRVRKYELDGTETNYGDNDIVIFRYADVLLMQAEALNELDDLTGAIDLINQVRARSYDPATPLVAGDFTKESLRTQILEERSRELFWEGWRRQDLIRHDVFCSKTWRQKERPTNDCETRLLFPIPKDVLDVNPNLTQNPGY